MRSTKQAALIGLFFLFFCSSLAISADKEILISFPQAVVGHAQRGNVLFVIHYKENDNNRRLVIVWGDEESGFGGSSEVRITSENNGLPVARDLDLPTGTYKFFAELIKSDGSKCVTNERRFVTR